MNKQFSRWVILTNFRDINFFRMIHKMWKCYSISPQIFIPLNQRTWDFEIWEWEKFKFKNWQNWKFASQFRKEPEIWVKHGFLLFILVKVVATESDVETETAKSLKRIPLPFIAEPNPRDSVPGKFCFLGFIKLVNY